MRLTVRKEEGILSRMEQERICPVCRTVLRHVRGAHYRCVRCGADYGLFNKQAPYTGTHCVRLRTPAQVRLAEEKNRGAEEQGSKGERE
jgi:ribosomal protein L37AE/L43A